MGARRDAHRVVAVAMLVVFGGAACAEPVATGPSTAPPTADPGPPLAASVFVYAVPPVSVDPTVIRVYQEAPGSGNMAFSFEPGEGISGVDAGIAGVYLVDVDHVRCDGSVELVGGMEADVKVEIGGDGTCVAVAAGRHEASMPHRLVSAGGGSTARSRLEQP